MLLVCPNERTDTQCWGRGGALLESAFLSLGGPRGVSQPVVLGWCWSAEYDSEVEDGAPIHRKRKGGKVTGADGQVPGGEDSDGSTGSRTSRYEAHPPTVPLSHRSTVPQVPYSA